MDNAAVCYGISELFIKNDCGVAALHNSFSISEFPEPVFGFLYDLLPETIPPVFRQHNNSPDHSRSIIYTVET